MDAFGAVKAAAAESGLSMYSVSKALGKNTGYMATAISRGSSPRSDTLASMANACGYSLCLVPSDAVPESAFVIDR